MRYKLSEPKAHVKLEYIRFQEAQRHQLHAVKRLH